MPEMAAPSEEQSQGIEQIEKAVVEMNQVTQRNAASAQDLASTMAASKVKESGGKHASPFRAEGEIGEFPA